MRRSTGKPQYGKGKQALIDAAIRLVARDGLSKLTYRALAAEARMSPGALQHHFSSIDALLDEALAYCIETSSNNADEIHSVADFIAVIANFVEAAPALVIFQVELFAAARLRPSLAILVARHQHAYRELVGSMLRTLGIAHDGILVDFITASVDGIVFQLVMQNDVSQRLRMDRQFTVLTKVISNYASLPSDDFAQKVLRVAQA